MKIKNGLDTTAGCSQKGDGQEDLGSPADLGNSVQDGGAEGGDADERRQEDGFETEGNVDNGLLKKFKPHVKGGGDSQPYNGHRWGLGCCHYVRQVAEEDTFRLTKRLNSSRPHFVQVSKRQVPQPAAAAC